MRRWLIFMSLLVAGLLMVGWGGDALAAILSMFTPNKPPVTQMMEPPSPVATMQPAEATPAVYAVEPAHIAREKKADRLRPIPPVQTAQDGKATKSVQAKPAGEKTWSLASLQAVPAPAQAVTPMQTGPMFKTAEPAQAKPAIEKARPMEQPAPEPFHTMHTLKKAKPGKAQSVESAQPPGTQPVQVAMLGAANLKAALPADASAPPEAPSADDLRRPDSKSACNGGRRVVSAYYWEGHHTASGQPFNPRAMTAAHRTLPFGTRLNVTNPRTGKTVNVVVNDRGPYVHGVSLDLSLGAAQAIGLQGTGSVCIL
jgi:rare lipoprotein A